MKKSKIIIYHLVIFIAGSCGIIIYLFSKLASDGGLGGVVVMPVIILVYTVAYGILCAISLGISLLVSYIRNKKKDL